MSEPIYTNTHINKKVRIDRRKMEKMVNTYSNTEHQRDRDTRTQTHKKGDTDPHNGPGHQHSESHTSVKIFRVTTVCLALLCVLLTGIIVLSVYYNKTIKDSESKNATAERDQLQTCNNNLTKERDQLQSSYNNLSKERDQLQAKLFVFEKHLQHLGWRYFGSSLYFLSTEKKSWKESREDCQKTEADLVIINSEEEQKFLSGLQKRSWIGLTDKDEEGTWKWVDGTILTRG
uniref:C-type lectin domain-containing protein n=2 Tax=Esox lucius TaxID=8010 RepID=A0A6Q2Z4E3_ESOLU